MGCCQGGGICRRRCVFTTDVENEVASSSEENRQSIWFVALLGFVQAWSHRLLIAYLDVAENL
jgi:hypothetical protein